MSNVELGCILHFTLHTGVVRSYRLTHARSQLEVIMSKLQITYDGSGHCTALQKAQGKTVAIDCPYAGGKEFSPTNLVGAGLASCMLLSMGTLAVRDKLDISGTCVDVELSITDKPIKRIGAIDLTFNMPTNFAAADRVKLESAAGKCPIKNSFHSEVPIFVSFNYPE